MKKKKHIKRRKVHEEHLQITALADILMVVLIFLLKSYSSSLSSVDDMSVPMDLKLPVTSTGGVDKGGFRVEVASDRIVFQGRKVASLEQYRFPASDLNQDLSDNGTSKTLYAMFENEVKKNNADTKTKVWRVADQRRA